eukprot:GCRY01004566.1.p1 GENE.GCRY01004566.1~~GCRY01004566.1.p1  ORF type:complete len:706 (+),score=210.89 GCRY01004566.1:210-2327(+)
MDNQDPVECAAQRIAEMLDSPEQLNKLESLRATVLRKKGALDAQLKSAMETQLDDANKGLDRMSNVFTLINHLSHGFQAVDSLCMECRDAISHYDLVREVAWIHANLRRTINDFAAFSSTPAQISEMLEMLYDDSDTILIVHKSLCQLENMHSKALSNTETDQERQTVKGFFKGITTLRNKVEEVLWETFSNALEVSQRNPSLLVKCLMVVEVEGAYDQAVLSAKRPPGRANDNAVVPTARCYQGIVIEHIQQAVKQRFRSLIENAEGVAALTEGMHKAIDDVALVFDYMVPCFPTKYLIYEFHVKLYYILIRAEIEQLCSTPSLLSTADILRLVCWCDEFHGEMEMLGVESDAISPPLSLSLQPLIAAYGQKLESLVSEWRVNIQNADNIHDVQGMGENQILTTISHINIFKIAHEQLDLVLSSQAHQLMECTVAVCLTMLQDYQKHYVQLMQNWAAHTIPLEYAIATLNGAVISLDHTTDLQDKLQSQWREDYDLAQIHNGFAKLAKAAVAAVVGIMFQDLAEFFALFFSDPDWRTQDPMEVVVDTLEDFFTDFSVQLVEQYFGKMVQECLRRLVGRYVQCLIKPPPGCKALPPGASDLMARDLACAKTFFLKYLPARRVDQALAVLFDIASLLSSEASMCGLYLTKLADCHPDFTLKLGFLLLERAGFTGSSLGLAKEECQSILKHRKEPTGVSVFTDPSLL